jgi:hypothetical protein
MAVAQSKSSRTVTNNEGIMTTQTPQERFTALTGEFREFKNGIDLETRQNTNNIANAKKFLHRTAEVLSWYITMNAEPETIAVSCTFYARAVIECERLGIDTDREILGLGYNLN